MFSILLLFKSNNKYESDKSLDNPLPNSCMFLILLYSNHNDKYESNESLDKPLPNS